MNKNTRDKIFRELVEVLKEQEEKDQINYLETTKFVLNGRQYSFTENGSMATMDRNSDEVVKKSLIRGSEELLIVYDGGWLYDVFNNFHQFEIEEKIDEVLEKYNCYREPVYSWCSVIVED